MFRWQCKERGVCSVHELDLLFDISRTISKAKNMEELIDPVLAQIADHMGMQRVMILIYNRNRSELLIDRATGLNPSEKARGIYRAGEGIIGKVLEGGKPIIVPRISQEPEFLNKTKSRNIDDSEDISFVCVPISLGDEVIGALTADRPCRKIECTSEDIRLLSLIGSLIAQRVRLRQEELEEIEKLQQENIRLNDELESRFTLKGIIGNSKKMKQVFSMIRRVASSSSTILIRGESGVGKEMVASAIHFSGNRKDKPFIKVNCAAIPENLIESELFGHERGSFTGAEKQHIGKFEQADQGTLFLDEIGDLSPQVQVKLLRVLQEKTIERVGGSESLSVDVRIITATHQPLEDLVEKNLFREDLFYRINVFPIHVPALRERASDILELANFFVEKYNKVNELNIKRISSPAIDMLLSYHWPGNVRELENCIERAGILSSDGVISGYNLPPTLQVPEETGAHTPERGMQQRLEHFEKEIITDSLKMFKGNMTKAALYLGISERVMGLRVSKYGIRPKYFKSLRNAS
jgi:Nif-specific regulatory protein